MFYSFCKAQISVRGAITRISSAPQYFSFVQNYALNSLSFRFISNGPSDEHSFTVAYLINSCGFSPESALSISKKVHFESPLKPDSVISFFKNHGFSQSQIRDLFKRKPKLLVSNPDKTLLPKFQFFYSKMISSSELKRVLSVNPDVLLYDLENTVIPRFNLFKDITQCSDDKVFLAYKNCSGILARSLESILVPNIALLREKGVPESFLLNIVVLHPRMFFSNREKFRRTVEEVKNLGFDPSKQFFLISLQALIQTSKSTWQRKLNVFKQWGWSDEDIVSAFENYPRCMMFSEDKIAANMDFFVNTMGWKSSYFADHPVLLSYSLEKRIIPRCSVLKALLSKGLIVKFSICSMMMYTEKKFLQKFVTPFEDPYFLKLYDEKQALSHQILSS